MDTKEDILKKAKRLRKELTPHIGRTSLEVFDDIIKEVVKLRKLIPKEDKRSLKALKIHFDSIWAEYPEKKGKHAAWGHFKAQVKTDDDVANIRKALVNYKADMIKVRAVHQERPWLHGSTWFNHRWEDFIDYQAPDKLEAVRTIEKVEPLKREDFVQPADLKKLVKDFNRKLKSAPRASNKFVEPIK